MNPRSAHEKCPASLPAGQHHPPYNRFLLFRFDDPATLGEPEAFLQCPIGFFANLTR